MLHPFPCMVSTRRGLPLLFVNNIVWTMITDKDILGFSGGSNMLSTFSRCDNKSGAVRSRPDILLDARESAVSLKSARPLFNVLNDYYDVMLTFNEAELEIGRAHV